MVADFMTVVVSSTEDEGAGHIDDQANDSDRNRLNVMNRLRDEDPLHRGHYHQSRDS